MFVNTKAYEESERAQSLNAAAEGVLREALPKLEEIELQVLLKLRGGAE